MGSDYLVIEYERMSPLKWYPPYLPYKIRMINNIIYDAKRNELLLEWIDKCLSLDRNVLVLSERVEHLYELMIVTEKKWKNKNVLRFFGARSEGHGKNRKPIEKNIKDPTREELLKANIIFATYEKAKDAINVPQMDTSLPATPMSSKNTVVQSKGRVERLVEGKNKPVVIDIVDVDFPLARGMAKKRHKIYAEKNMNRILTLGDIKK